MMRFVVVIFSVLLLDTVAFPSFSNNLPEIRSCSDVVCYHYQSLEDSVRICLRENRECLGSVILLMSCVKGTKDQNCGDSCYNEVRLGNCWEERWCEKKSFQKCVDRNAKYFLT